MAVLCEAVELGITHIDTSDFYGPYVTNEIIRLALHPYPEGRHLVTKVGSLRGADGSWNKALAPAQLRRAVHDNLDHLGLEVLDAVNLRVGGFDRPEPGSIAEPFAALGEMQRDGLIRHLGLSTVTAEQIADAEQIAPVVCVQNFYNIAHRADDPLIDSLADHGIAYVPYSPLGCFTPLQSDSLSTVAHRLDATPLAVALAWLLQRSPNILLIPGTSSIAHLRVVSRLAGGVSIIVAMVIFFVLQAGCARVSGLAIGTRTLRYPSGRTAGITLIVACAAGFWVETVLLRHSEVGDAIAVGIIAVAVGVVCLRYHFRGIRRDLRAGVARQ